MKRRRSITIIALAVLLTIAFAAGASASDGLKSIIAKLYPESKISVDGSLKTMVPAIQFGNKTYLEVESLGLALNMYMWWDDVNRQLTVDKSRPAYVPAAGSGTGGTKVTERMQFSTMVKYEATYLGNTYPILANEYKGTIYFHLNDVLAMGIDVSGLKAAEEKYTKSQFVAVQQLADRWSEMPKFNLLRDPVVSGSLDSKQLALLSAYGNQIHAIRQLPGTTEYELLNENTVGGFQWIKVKLSSVATSSDIYWYVSSAQHSFIDYTQPE